MKPECWHFDWRMSHLHVTWTIISCVTCCWNLKFFLQLYTCAVNCQVFTLSVIWWQPANAIISNCSCVNILASKWSRCTLFQQFKLVRIFYFVSLLYSVDFLTLNAVVELSTISFICFTVFAFTKFWTRTVSITEDNMVLLYCGLFENVQKKV